MMKRFPIFALLAIAIAPNVYAQSGDSDQADPHWRGSGCQACHESATPVANDLGLKSEAPEELCESCHGKRGDAVPCRHNSDISPGAFESRLPETYAANLGGGKIVCTTCHDLAVQCKNPKRTLQYKNPGFLRDGRFPASGEQCYLCHEGANFEKFSPHEEVAGTSESGNCLLCHENAPRQNDDGTWQPVNFNMKANLNDACYGCHRVQSHPAMMTFSRRVAEWAHLVAPSEKVLRNMQKFADEGGVMLPLEQGTGRVHCATCHNPHHDGMPGYPVAENPGSKYRLRAADMCGVCHDL